jgi:hypothetical protein
MQTMHGVKNFMMIAELALVIVLANITSAK